MLRAQPRNSRRKSLPTRGRRISPRSLVLLPASKVFDRLEVDVEVVRRGTKRAGHGPLVLRIDRFQGAAHVCGQLAAATVAQRIADRLLQIATRTLPSLRESRHLLPIQFVHLSARDIGFSHTM